MPRPWRCHKLRSGPPTADGRPGGPGRVLFTWVREAPEALVVWVESVEDKDALIASAPDRFFTTDHYDGAPVVLVNLQTVDADEAAELLADSWRVRAPKKLVTQFDHDRNGPKP